MPSALLSKGTALITGAASGIGFATAKLCRGKGMHLALVDIDGSNLEKAKCALSDSSGSALKIETFVLDTSNRAGWADVATKVKDGFKDVDVLLLNAGATFRPKEQPANSSILKPWLDTEYWEKVWVVSTFKRT